MAASEGVLGMLHEAVAKSLLEKIASGEATASDVSNAIKMLKDNSITCVVEEGSELGALQKELDEKGKRPLGADKVDLSAALEQLDFTVGVQH